ncbi:hypothetical protein [Embleya sp. NPDC005575]|uniref:hypothetical protein n=1 Tax=Embleya sp. NPDC005575 TaxID=3156892 RepID=UPI0033A193BD
MWRAGEPADLPSPEPRLAPTRTWPRAEAELATTLRALCADMPAFPGRFILHFQSGRDRLRYVSAWSDGLDLCIEAFNHHAEPGTDPDRLGWTKSGDRWQRRFDDAVRNSGHADSAATMLVDAIAAMGVDVDDLAYHGTISGRGCLLHLDLPDLTLMRIVEPDD